MKAFLFRRAAMFEHQISQEREELKRYPKEEAEELALIYAARGIPIA
jgi:vacuolar iron transporter family protein